MANPNIARGMIPVKHRNGAPYTGAARMYYVPASDATALFIGDPVIVVTDADDGKGCQTVTRATVGATNYITGVVVGVVSGGTVARTADKPVYRVASTEAYVLVADDPDLLFEIQEDSAGGAMGAGSVGRNASLASGSGNTVSGYSGFLLDSSDLGTGATKQLRIVEYVDRCDNAITEDYAKWLVSINLHSLRNTTGV